MLNGTESTIETLKRISTSLSYRKKIGFLTKSLCLVEQSKPQLNNDLKTLHPGYRDARWHLAYSAVNGIESPYYVPEDIFYSILERTLNPRDRIGLYRDKDLYEKVGLSSGIRPIAGIIRGRIFTADYQLVKASDIDLGSARSSS